MWGDRQHNDGYDEQYELLRPSDAGASRDNADGDSRKILFVKLATLSYESTVRLIIYFLIVLTALLLIATCAVFGSSITSIRKARYNVSGIVPSVSITSGNCETLKYVNLVMHLLINCLGTAIIGCSNYLQQSEPSLCIIADGSLYESYVQKHTKGDERVR
jgi:hypothetical protein